LHAPSVSEFLSPLFPTVPVPPYLSSPQFVVNPFTAWLMIKELQVPRGEWIVQTAAGE
jgi:NADPH:quinone reductase-like Zn-dependent oxidoreductase